MKEFIIVVFFLLFLMQFRQVDAQDSVNFNADRLFSIARAEFFEGKKSEGQAKLRYILEKSPGYDEVRIFLARTYAWDGMHPLARTELQAILKNDSTHRDALNVLIDVELWSRNFHAALTVVQKARQVYPNDESLLYKEVNALISLGRNKEALLNLDRFLQLYPAHEKGRALYDSIRFHNRKYRASMAFGTESFNRVFEPSYYLTAQVTRGDSWGTSAIRLNYAHRFDIEGSQLELDLYPKISRAIYGYFNYAYSESALFPDNRMATEIFFKLPAKLEMSAGIRYMDFEENQRIVMYTGSLGWYFSNYWLSIRPFITPNETNTSVSATLVARRYFANAENYLELNGAVGFSPDIGGLQNSTGLSENAIYLLKSQRVGGSWQRSLLTTWTINLSVYGARQELAFDQNRYALIAGSFISVGKKL